MDAIRFWSAAAAILAVVIGIAAYLAIADGPMPERQLADALAEAGFEVASEPVLVSNREFIGQAGKISRLSDFRGKVLLVNFWASWCAPCLTEMPTLEALQRDLGGPGFQVIPISIDREGVDTAAKFLKRIEVTVFEPFADRSGRIIADHDIRTMPTTLLVNPDGYVIATLVGPAEWDSPAMTRLLRGVSESYSNI